MGNNFRTLQTLLRPGEIANTYGNAVQKFYIAINKYGRAEGKQKLQIFKKEVAPKMGLVTAAWNKVNTSIQDDLLESVKWEANKTLGEAQLNLKRGEPIQHPEMEFTDEGTEIFKDIRIDFKKDKHNAIKLKRYASHNARECKSIKSKLSSKIFAMMKKSHATQKGKILKFPGQNQQKGVQQEEKKAA